ncbi:P-loop containing nucleoside triphosphate hydrolases superfamily protein [Perilla frutescens var. frutescens]|nr:P-loop containing nucleoside triphosphate hydrolases superfamily protein [Perilla frutescens var. frutescens]
MENSRTSNPRRRSWTPSSMPRTLWSSTESPTKDFRSNDDQKTVNVQVVVRCRPLSEDEVRARASLMISCDETKQQVIASQNTGNKQTDRVFMFDKVFGPTSQQKELYDDVVAPVISEVLEGYSWTIFAYGQTGTGKTYTMEGEGRKQKNAGVIPRAVQQIFDVLESEKADYSMKATFLELYNEEITDLLASDDQPKRPLVLMEDGKGAVFVRGLEEEIVCSVDEIYAVLDKGSSRKHTAETLLNKQSNRSHSIFTITIQIKEPNSSDGSELIRCGKLNLVDLAGSENILRSGAREVRAREAGEINKSLLTLGRVINALADSSTHVPYRDSKLTRLLRDSLGGKTKTCIIATISPSILSQEETLSTLDYAFRAKCIKNRPEVNQKLMKSTLIKDLYSQIDSLKQELHATRQRNGSYASEDERHSADALRKQLMEIQELYIFQQQLRVDLEDKLERNERELATARQSLFNLEDQYQQAIVMCKDKETLIFNLISSGKELTKKALELRSDIEGAASDVSTLFAKIEHKNCLEDTNRQHIQNFYSHLVQQLRELDKAISASATSQEQNWKAIQDNTQSFLASKSKAIDELLKQTEYLNDLCASGVKNLDVSAEELYQNSQLALSRLSSELSAHSSCIVDLVTKNSSDADAINNDLKSNMNNLRSRIDASIRLQEENHARDYQASKYISSSLVNFFKTLRVYISKLTLIEEDSRTITNQKLHAFTTKFEEFSLAEERLLLEQMAQLLANSSSRKKKMATAVDDVLESASNRSDKLNQEISDMQSLTADGEEKWNNFIAKTETNYVEDSAAIEAGKCTLEEGLQCCMRKLAEVSQQQRMSEESLLVEINKNFDSDDSHIKNGTSVNEKIHARFSSLAASLLEETDDATKRLMLSAENPLRLDHEASEKANLLSSRCLVCTKETSTIHSEQVAEISRTARKSLLDDYLVDNASCVSPRKRNLILPSREEIECLIISTLGDSLQPDNAVAS